MSLRLYGEYDRKDVCQMNALQLAYIGDAVWEIIVRDAAVYRGLNVRHMHGTCVEYVNAHAQAGFLQDIMNILTPEETEIARRGRNAHARHPIPRNQDPGDYSAATGFEALIGYLYLTGQEDRLTRIASKVIKGEEYG